MRGGPVVDLTHSSQAELLPIPISAVTLTDTFWLPRITANREVTIPAQLKQCEETGRIDNLRRAAGLKDCPFQGIYFNDSDVYKWVEAASYSLGTHPDANLEAKLDEVISVIAAAQQPDGYLNSYFMFERERERFTNLKDMHEIYCAGHLIQAAVAHARSTGKRTLLDVACRLADHLDTLFGPGKPARACGHEEAEMALVELFRETRGHRYLDLARTMIEARGQQPGIFGNSAYHQDHLPFAAQTEFVGHAVRHLYFACGAADAAAELDLLAYRTALAALWQDLTQRKMYVTGGAGSRYEGEAFGAAYELPNERAYTETCAAIASAMWNWRLLNITGEAKYADLMERTLYNAVLPGLSLDGMHYFYQNPLADRGGHRRQSWFGCACCPPNVARLLASLTGYWYSTDRASAVYCHLYGSNVAAVTLPSGGEMRIVQTANYPWSGEIRFDIELRGAAEADLYLRIPDWAQTAEIVVEGAAWTTTRSHSGVFYGPAGAVRSAETNRPGYFRAGVRGGTRIDLSIPMPIERIASHPHVASNLGRVALQRGPLIYCIEQADHQEDVWDIALPAGAGLAAEHRPSLLGGVTVLTGPATAVKPVSNDLYTMQSSASLPADSTVELTAIPYFAWANRTAGPMQVWLPECAGESKSG